MDMSEQVNELAAALTKAQAEIKGASRDSENPFFQSKYADLASVWDACRAALTNHGLSVAQGVGIEGVGVQVTTLLLHSSGQWLRATAISVPKDLSPQSIGSATTYLRRYGLAAMAGVAPEDDDGNAAQGPQRDDVPFDYEPPDETADPRPAFAKGEKRCPYCKKATVIKGKAEYGGGWVCFAKRGGCGQKWSESAPSPTSPSPPSSSPTPSPSSTSTPTPDNRAYLIGEIAKDAAALHLTATEKKLLAGQYLGGLPAQECQDEAALNRLLMFLGDPEAVRQWRAGR